MAQAISDGDAPAVVAKTIVTAATDAQPELRYTAGPMAARARILRRLAPAGRHLARGDPSRGRSPVRAAGRVAPACRSRQRVVPEPDPVQGRPAPGPLEPDAVAALRANPAVPVEGMHGTANTALISRCRS
ncbi:hypothetical protein [Streptomyces sp. NPDC050121]|uniref:hypothetical protein n=1 Tax=Streptomyces sp. NPDC050121 TaxID=3365601 RepID=UPI0037887DCF